MGKREKKRYTGHGCISIAGENSLFWIIGEGKTV
jgi:hypothetical protein